MLMTGTPFRTDGAPVYGLEYGNAHVGDLHQFADEDKPFLPKGTFACGIWNEGTRAQTVGSGTAVKMRSQKMRLRESVRTGTTVRFLPRTMAGAT